MVPDGTRSFEREGATLVSDAFIFRQDQHTYQPNQPTNNIPSYHRSALMCLVSALFSASSSDAFVPTQSLYAAAGTGTHPARHLLARTSASSGASGIILHMVGDNDLPADDTSADDEGVSLASDFFKAVQGRNIQLDDTDLYDDEDDEDEDDDDEQEINFPQSAINAALGFDAGPGADSMAGQDGNVTISNSQVYSELKDRVLDTAGCFVELVGGARDDDDEDGDDDGQPKPYKPPTKVPDPELTAGEVVTTVLDALLHNDVPNPDTGVGILFGYSSPGSAIMSSIRDEGMTAAEYSEFLSETEYKVLFDHSEVVIDKGDYSFDRKKAFYTARLRTGPGALDVVSVNFILSTQGNEEDDCWLIDSMLIRPEKMRRRRRR